MAIVVGQMTFIYLAVLLIATQADGLPGGSFEEATKASQEASEHKEDTPKLAAGPPSSLLHGFELGQPFAPLGELPLSVAGKCFLALAMVHFLVNAMLYIVQEKKQNLPDLKASGVAGQLEEMFSEEHLSTASDSLTFVAPVAVLMLFILFRSFDQGREVSSYVQQFYYLTVVGIVLQASDVVCHINIITIGNASKIFGMLFTYVGHAGIVVGLFVDRDESVPLSGGALCITLLSSLLFALQLLVKFLEYKEQMPGKELYAAVPSMLPGLSTEQLDSALVVCENVPILCTIIFWVHFQCRFAGALVPDEVLLCMYATVAGIYLQCFGGILLGSLNEAVGRGAAIAGLLVQMGGAAGTLALGVTAVGSGGSVLIETFLELVVAVLLCLVLIKLLEGFLASQRQYLTVFQKCLSTMKYAAVISVLLLYLHFRGVVTGAVIPDPVLISARVAVYSLLFQAVLLIMQAVMSKVTADGSFTAPAWLSYVQRLAVMLLYIAFGMLVFSAFQIGVPEAPAEPAPASLVHAHSTSQVSQLATQPQLDKSDPDLLVAPSAPLAIRIETKPSYEHLGMAQLLQGESKSSSPSQSAALMPQPN